jgi:CDGSH-type Zn-finger protein
VVTVRLLEPPGLPLFSPGEQSETRLKGFMLLPDRIPEGEEVVNAHFVRAPCRCGKSASNPWSGGTHKVARFSASQIAQPPPTETETV